MELKKTGDLSALSQTLFIPLAVRAKETCRANPLVKDSMAVSIYNGCETGNLVTDGGEISAHGILARTIVIDDEVRNFIERNPRPTVINLGAGLDTRFFRLKNSRVKWYDVDLPEVIALRRKFFKENAQLHFISGSALDAGWIREIPRTADDAVLIIAEGLLMYFCEEDVTKILTLLRNVYPQADLIFDAVHSFFTGKKISSDFLWGLDNVKSVENLVPGFHVIRSWSTGDLLKERQSLLLRLLNIFPSTRNRSRIIHLKLNGTGLTQPN